MLVQSGCFLISRLLLVVVVTLLDGSDGLQYMVGDTGWSIPPTPDFYTNWSSSHSFHIGDILFFDFESQLHNVMLVSRREYESCTANQAYRAFTLAPAVVPLMEKGNYYFICSVSNYCALGQRLAVAVYQRSDIPVSTSPLMPIPQNFQPPGDAWDSTATPTSAAASDSSSSTATTGDPFSLPAALGFLLLLLSR